MHKKILSYILLTILTVTFITGCSKPQIAADSNKETSATGSNEDSNMDGSDTEDAAADEVADDTAEDVQSGDDNQDQGSGIQGITVNQIKYDIVDLSTLSEQMQADINSLIINRGYEYWLQEDGSFLILISAGEKSTGGYGIQVNSVEDNEGKTIIAVTETEPAADSMATEVMTYPSVIIRASGITDRFVIYDQNRKEYSRLVLDGTQQNTGSNADQSSLRIGESVVDYSKPIECIYQGQTDDQTIAVLVGETEITFSSDNMKQLIEGIQTGDKIEITASISPSDQISVEGIKKIQ